MSETNKNEGKYNFLIYYAKIPNKIIDSTKTGSDKWMYMINWKGVQKYALVPDQIINALYLQIVIHFLTKRYSRYVRGVQIGN